MKLQLEQNQWENLTSNSRMSCSLHVLIWIIQFFHLPGHWGRINKQFHVGNWIMGPGDGTDVPKRGTVLFYESSDVYHGSNGTDLDGHKPLRVGIWRWYHWWQSNPALPGRCTKASKYWIKSQPTQHLFIYCLKPLEVSPQDPIERPGGSSGCDDWACQSSSSPKSFLARANVRLLTRLVGMGNSNLELLWCMFGTSLVNLSSYFALKQTT